MKNPVFKGYQYYKSAKKVMHGFWYDYLKPNYGEKINLCYVDTESFKNYIKTRDIYVDIAKDVETKIHTSNCQLESLLSREKIKFIRLMNDEISGKK